MFDLFRNESSDPTRNAERNLSGRTHYVDPDTRRFHKARVNSAREVQGGTLFYLIESVAMDMDNRKRGFRYVVFDVSGYVVARVALENCWGTSEKAATACYAWMATADGIAITEEAIKRQERHNADKTERLRAKLAELAANKES